MKKQKLIQTSFIIIINNSKTKTIGIQKKEMTVMELRPNTKLKRIQMWNKLWSIKISHTILLFYNNLRMKDKDN